MTAKIISKVLEIENCNKEELLKAIYTEKFWETISPVKKIEAKFSAPNVLYSKIVDDIKIINIPVEMEGELVLSDKGEQEGKGRLIEMNVRNNEDIKALEGRLRVKQISPNKSKVGVFIHNFKVSSSFLNLIGGAFELILRSKITDILRNIEKYCKNNSLNEFIQ